MEKKKFIVTVSVDDQLTDYVEFAYTKIQAITTVFNRYVLSNIQSVKAIEVNNLEK